MGINGLARSSLVGSPVWGRSSRDQVTISISVHADLAVHGFGGHLLGAKLVGGTSLAACLSIPSVVEGLVCGVVC